MATISKEWWKTAVAYQIYPRSFCDSNGDGIGDIPGIISKLHYLKELGIDVISLTSIFPSPNIDGGYDISDYKDVNPEFGTIEDFDRLVAKAKRLGIKVVIDVALNCTSDEHEWFKKALNNDSQYRDYYHIVETKNGHKPNNWTSFFGGSAWEKLEDKLYYLHLFHKKQPDLNWHNPKVFEEFCDIFRFWLDHGVAGFRLKMSNIIYKNSFDNGVTKTHLIGREHYTNADGCHDIIHRFRKEVFSKYKAVFVGETIFGDSEAAKYFCDPEREEFDLVFPFEFNDVETYSFRWLRKKYSPKRFLKFIDEWQRTVYWPCNFFESHDHVRCINQYGDVALYWRESAKLLGGLNVCLKGSPFIYEGQEIGMTNGDFTRIRQLHDVESHSFDTIMKKMKLPRNLRRTLIFKSSRDNSRTPMQWDESEYGGFSESEPWIKINSNKSFINVDAESDDEASILRFYQKLIDIRKNSDSLSNGTYRRVASESDVFIFTREAESDRVYVYANMTPFNRVVEFYGETILLDNYPDEKLESNRLLPYEFRLIKARV